MLNNNETKENLKFIANVKAFAIFFIALMIMDIVLLLTTKVTGDVNYVTIIVANLALAGILQFLFALLGRKGLIIVEIIVFLILLFTIVETLLYGTYGLFMPLSSIVGGAQNVREHYSDELVKVVGTNVTFIIRFVIFYAAFIVASNEYLVRKKDIVLLKDMSKIEKLINIVVLVISILAFIVNIVLVDRSNDFSYNVQKNGLKVAAVKSIFKTSESIKIETSNTAVDEGPEESDDENTADDFFDKYNVLDIDYMNLDETHLDDRGKNVNEYVAKRKPSNKNEYTGIFKGKNLIMICAEAYSHYVMDERLTPTLYRLTNNGFKFTDFYVPSWGGSTTSGEFAFLNGIIPNDAVKCMEKTIGKNMCFTMPRVLKREGYNTGAYHNGNYKYYDRNLTHRENMGFDYFIATGNGIEDIAGAWPIDEAMIEATFESYHGSEPFCMYYMTLTGHAFYNADDNSKVIKNIKKVKEVYGDKYPNQVNNYICYQLYLEDALKKLLECLEKYDLLDDTVICMVSDHYPYGLNSVAFTNGVDYIPYLYGETDLDQFDLDKNMPIIWASSLEKEYSELEKVVDAPTSTIDLLPTLLNLFGASYDSRLIAGRDVFSDTEPFVVYNSGAFITKDGRYSKYHNKFISNDGSYVSKEYVDEYKEKARNLILFSAYIVEENYYNYILTNKNVSSELKKGMSAFNIDIPEKKKKKDYNNFVEYFKKCNEDYINSKKTKKVKTEKNQKTVYLTFDDGPNKYSDKILEILKKHNIKATFFVAGTNKEKGLKKIKDEGHTIGLHSASHNYSYVYKNAENFLRDLYDLQNYVYQVTGEYVHYMRFPGGSRNKVSDEINLGIMEELREMVEELGFEYYDWHVATGDSSRDVAKEYVLSSVRRGIAKGYDEMIVLMHDIHPITIEVLEDVIELCEENGYVFDKINDDTEPFHAKGVS